jgi:hypothetical protein
MDYNEWFKNKVDPIVLVNGDLSIKEFGAIVHRATLRGDIKPQELVEAQKQHITDNKSEPQVDNGYSRQHP